jgi:hypothetical protein
LVLGECVVEKGLDAQPIERRARADDLRHVPPSLSC